MNRGRPKLQFAAFFQSSPAITLFTDAMSILIKMKHRAKKPNGKYSVHVVGSEIDEKYFVIKFSDGLSKPYKFNKVDDLAELLFDLEKLGLKMLGARHLLKLESLLQDPISAEIEVVDGYIFVLSGKRQAGLMEKSVTNIVEKEIERIATLPEPSPMPEKQPESMISRPIVEEQTVLPKKEEIPLETQFDVNPGDKIKAKTEKGIEIGLILSELAASMELIVDFDGRLEKIPAQNVLSKV